MNLVRVELRRLASRRLFRVLSALVIAGFTVAAVLTFVNSNDSPAAVAAAEAEGEAAIGQCVDNSRSGHEAVGETPRDGRNARAVCEEEVWVEDPRFRYTDVEWILMSMGVPMIMLAWLLGASFMGAEWTNRTLTTTLTWEPRRVRVLAAKAAALSLIAFAWVLSFQTYVAAALYPAAHFNGDTSGIDAAFWGDIAGVGVRVAALGVVAALMGFALATVGRNTAAALGVGFVQLALVEGLIRAFRPQWTDWLIGDNLSLFLAGAEEVDHVGHSQVAAGLLLATYGLVLLAGAAATFRRREIA